MVIIWKTYIFREKKKYSKKYLKRMVVKNRSTCFSANCLNERNVYIRKPSMANNFCVEVKGQSGVGSAEWGKNRIIILWKKRRKRGVYQVAIVWK